MLAPLSPEARAALERIVWQACWADLARQERERIAASQK